MALGETSLASSQPFSSAETLEHSCAPEAGATLDLLMREFDLHQGYFPRLGYAAPKRTIHMGSCKERGSFMPEFFVAAMGGIWLLIVIIAMMPRRGNSDYE
jgi:hypothetical protein